VFDRDIGFVPENPASVSFEHNTAILLHFLHFVLFSRIKPSGLLSITRSKSTPKNRGSTQTGLNGKKDRYCLEYTIKFLATIIINAPPITPQLLAEPPE
jgi:hypothetical protein